MTLFITTITPILLFLAVMYIIMLRNQKRYLKSHLNTTLRNFPNDRLNQSKKELIVHSLKQVGYDYETDEQIYGLVSADE